MPTRLQSLKADLAERLLLGVYRPLQAKLSSSHARSLEEFRGKRKVLLTMVPTHGNLGDHAIAYATRSYLSDCLPEFAVIEVSLRDIYRLTPALKRTLEAGDMVMLLGGGNTGDLYRHEEWTRRFVVREFDRWPMVSLPQTAHFTSTPRGRREMRASRRIYSRHPRFLFLSRDPSTDQMVKREMPDIRTTYQPDMVLYLDESTPASPRSGISTCLRQDRESALGPVGRARVLDELVRCFGHVAAFDTIADHDIGESTRSAELDRLWAYLRGVQLSITDRLHGMLFSFITRTPCVAIRSFDSKVTEAFRALEGHQNFLFLAEEPTPEAVFAAASKALKVVQPWADDTRSLWFDSLRATLLSVADGDAAPFGR